MEKEIPAYEKSSSPYRWSIANQQCRPRTNDVGWRHSSDDECPVIEFTVTDWYKQDIYNRADAKIGDVKDVLVGPNGQINAVIVGVGGFLGAGEKDVAVNFSSIKQTMKDNKIYLTMDTTKDALRSAPGFKYDSNKTSWVPEKS